MDNLNTMVTTMNENKAVILRELRTALEILQAPQDVINVTLEQVLMKGIDAADLNKWLSALVHAPEQGAALDPKLTNLQLVEQIMMYSAYGSLVQIFVIEAIRYYAESISKQPIPENKEDLINPRHWWAIAKEISDKLEKKYNMGDTRPVSQG